MQHLIITIGIIAFGMGIASLMAVHRYQVKLNLDYLETYFKYLVILNISVLINLALHYLLTNVWASMNIQSKVIIIISGNIIGFYLLVILTFLFLKLIRSLVEKSIGKPVKQFLTAIIVLASLAYGFSTAAWVSSSKISIFLWTHKIFISVPIVISLTATLFFAAHTRFLNLSSKRKILLIFGIFYIIFYAYQLFLWFFPIQVWISVSAFNLLALNIVPIPFLGSFLKSEHSRTVNHPVTRERIENFYRSHGLTKREMEIADLIVAGKSNEEIEKELYISIFTVKKHVSNIFMKMDINSRSQLIRMTFQSVLDRLDTRR